MIVSDDRVARFVSGRIGKALCPPFTAIGLEQHGEIVGGAVFNQFEGADVHVTVAGSSWTPGFVRAVGHYVFEQLACLRMTVTTENPVVVGYALRLGGEVEGRLRNHFGEGRDAVIVGILQQDWKPAKIRRFMRG